MTTIKMSAADWKRPFKESKTGLKIIDSNLEATPICQLKNKGTIEVVHLDMDGRCDDQETPFDMGTFSDLAAQHLPKFHRLVVTHTLIRNFRLESTTLKELSLDGPEVEDGSWDIKCPNLRCLSMEHHSPPSRKFHQALINCPRIETFTSHKYWIDEPLPTLYLPNCTRFTYLRGDGTWSLKLYLPKVKELYLNFCYELNSLQLVKRGHPDHKEWNLARGATPSKFCLGLIHARLSNKSKRSLLDTGRVMNPSVFDEDGEGEDSTCSMS